MDKKGFTLIELLAVIIILAIISLISVPIITNLTKDAKNSAYKSTTLNYIEELEKTINFGNYTNGTYETAEFEVEAKGTLPSEGTVKIKGDVVVEATLCMNGKKVKYENKNVTIIGNCTRGSFKPKYKETLLNGADPVLKGDMIPVTIENNGTVKKADITSEWYKYENKKWANAVVLLDNTSYNKGDTIPENKIKAYYVWIPRYKYKLFSNTTESTIDITFENNKTEKSKSTTIGQYLTHPAFTYGSEELNGFWVGKFEPSVVETDACYTSDNTTNCNKELKNPRIKPNVKSLRNQQILNQYLTSLNVSDYSKMMKNDEWGAVSYLSHSTYGLNGKVRINNNNKYTTGCGASSADSLGAVATCQTQYGSTTNYPQSTTGNITGIFDTSGGAWEYVMAVFADKEGKAYSGRNNIYHSSFNGKFGRPGTDSSDSSIKELTSGINYPNNAEYNLYYNQKDTTDNRTNTNINNGCNGSKCYGQSLSETMKSTGGTGSWYGESSYFVSYSEPWLNRGGYYNNGENAGIFSFASNYGHNRGSTSFRVVVR